MAWDGSTWSIPQLQSTLSSFTDPVTLDSVGFQCKKTALSQRDLLFVVGCNVLDPNDIWITSRELGPVTTWFPEPSGWTEPFKLTSNTQEIDQLLSQTDEFNRFHLFWVQEEIGEGGIPTRSGFYARKENGFWSSPVQVLESPDHYIDNLAITIDNQGRLLAVWNGGVSGGIYFSWASSSLATSAFEWSETLEIPVPAYTPSYL